ncbi:MAG: ADP-ribosylglycohydrolase [Nitrospinota bacterium]|nr:MAG: ADP-ribosylglycohydrolase [Nitrospinota bacterium]
MSNSTTLDYLFDTAQIQLRRGPLFDKPPDPMPGDLDFDRVAGMMLGLAIGDALGNTTEGMLPQKRRQVYGEVRDYLPNPYARNAAVGLPSDDTQLAFWTLEQMIVDRGFNPERVAARFAQGRVFGIGSTVQRFLYNYQAGRPWYRCGPRSAGNGALMRIAPMLIPHLPSGTTALWVDTALSAMMTHNDSGSIAACLAFIAMLWHLLSMSRPPEPYWWIETYVSVARELELDEHYRPRGGIFQEEYEGPIWRFVEEKVPAAYRRGLSVVEACQEWLSGAFLLETVPSVLFILMRHGEDPEEAMVRAVNDTVDNDTIGAIVGAAMGALHGKAGIPERWRTHLVGRTSEGDDGKVFALLEEARAIWGNRTNGHAEEG